MFGIKFFKRFVFRRQVFRSVSDSAFNVKDILSLKPFNENLVVQGWVQAVRGHKDIYFVDVIDGSCINKLQVVIEANENKAPVYGSSIRVEGQLVESKHKGQDVELLCKFWKIVGFCSDDYPFSNRLKYSQEYIRQFPHLRPRTRTFGSILRIRNYASQAVYQFFQEKGFYLVHTPIITNNDCEGAGEVFSVQANQVAKENTENDSRSPLSKSTNGKNRRVKENFFDHCEDSDDEISNEAIAKTVENEDEFFGEPAYLSVSGQLHLEAAACALSRVYSFGPVFRAEGSHSRMHASEFYMIEAEVAFVNSLDCLTKLAQSCIKAVAESLLNNCKDEVHWIKEKHSSIYSEYLKRVVSEPFVIMSYSEAITLLQRDQSSFEHEIKPGKDFSPDHKRYLLKYCDNIPVIVTMFPSKIKPFYMKEDSEGQAYCFDVFAPFGGEICGGSLREDSEQNLQSKLEALGIQERLSWYLDLRKYGGVPLGGFGIGFDRLLQSILGISNIRDVIPFPRRKNDCKC